ncbi:MAG: hypothetical protein LV480_00655 [Methylacidiphilales bacterium]|nr:hypothetical protein [Candidatus Methylacidiphilales bacterium]
MSTLEIIVEDLKSLPTPKLEEAAAYIHRLRETSRVDRLSILRETSGSWSSEDADLIEKAIEENCEKIDARDW